MLVRLFFAVVVCRLVTWRNGDLGGDGACPVFLQFFVQFGDYRAPLPGVDVVEKKGLVKERKVVSLGNIHQFLQLQVLPAVLASVLSTLLCRILLVFFSPYATLPCVT